MGYQIGFEKRFSLQPYIVTGDFDGNGQQDYAVRILSTSSVTDARYHDPTKIISLLSQGDALTPHELVSGEYVTLVEKGTPVSGFTGDESILLSHDAVASGHFEKSG